MKVPLIFLVRNFMHAVLISLLLWDCESFSQNLYTIEGKVTDSKTGEPLEFVNVFLSQTTIGATTNADGKYRIDKIPRGIYPLVASMVGYESIVTTVDLTNDNKIIVNLSLERSVYEFNQIVVQGEIPTRWFDQLEIFKRELFGKNNFAKKCIIKNPYQIDFKEEGRKLTATAGEPIIIQNNALGYKIECVLKGFVYDRDKRTSAFQIYPSFTELTTSTKDSAEEYQANRTNVYLGSLAHLLKSLVVNNYKFKDEGFTLYTTKLRDNPFERYYPRENVVRRASDIVRADSVTNQYYLMANNSLLITYWNSGKHTFSIIRLLTGITEFDPGGFLIFTDEFNITGAMASEGVATMLPRNWKPPEEKE
jgi:hypothetical protein